MSQRPTRTDSGYQLGSLIVEKLPPRQAQTLLFCAAGFSDRKSAEAMQCSISTVKQAKQALFYKLNANCGTEVITKAFANAYLRFAGLLIALFLGISAPVINDHNAIARIGRTRPSNQLRARSNGKTRNGNGIYWSPETNELVWG